MCIGPEGKILGIITTIATAQASSMSSPMTPATTPAIATGPAFIGARRPQPDRGDSDQPEQTATEYRKQPEAERPPRVRHRFIGSARSGGFLRLSRPGLQSSRLNSRASRYRRSTRNTRRRRLLLRQKPSRTTPADALALIDCLSAVRTAPQPISRHATALDIRGRVL